MSRRFLLVFALSVLFSRTLSAEPADIRQEIELRVERSDYRGALTLVRQILASDPQDAWAKLYADLCELRLTAAPVDLPIAPVFQEEPRVQKRKESEQKIVQRESNRGPSPAAVPQESWSQWTPPHRKKREVRKIRPTPAVSAHSSNPETSTEQPSGLSSWRQGEHRWKRLREQWEAVHNEWMDELAGYNSDKTDKSTQNDYQHEPTRADYSRTESRQTDWESQQQQWQESLNRWRETYKELQQDQGRSMMQEEMLEDLQSSPDSANGGIGEW